jgi:hypothetical protein
MSRIISCDKRCTKKDATRKSERYCKGLRRKRPTIRQKRTYYEAKEQRLEAPPSKEIMCMLRDTRQIE